MQVNQLLIQKEIKLSCLESFQTLFPHLQRGALSVFYSGLSLYILLNRVSFPHGHLIYHLCSKSKQISYFHLNDHECVRLYVLYDLLNMILDL